MEFGVCVARHMRIHAGHCTYLLREEVKFVTPDLIKGTCLVGAPEEMIEPIRQLEASGLQQMMILPSLATQYGVIEQFAREVMEKV